MSAWYRWWTWKKFLVCSGLLMLILGGSAASWLHFRIRASLPLLDGVVVVEGLDGEVKIERDAQGVPTITAASRDDTAFALGFLHAQDRLFQMDLGRRLPAGQLSALFGGGTAANDEMFRRQRFQELAAKVVQSLPPEHARVFSAYTRGVNCGIAHLKAAPFEYLLLRTKPTAWRDEDSVLIVLGMMAILQPMDGVPERGFGLLKERVPPEVFDFLVQNGSEWDTPLDASRIAPPSIPPADVWSLRDGPALEEQQQARAEPVAREGTNYLPFRARRSEFMPGSNNWAITSELGRDGRAILASDMHLPLGVPATWYRAVMNTPTVDGTKRRLAGLTLPGSPLLVAGSNGSVAWGYTNSMGDFGDVIELKQTSQDADEYLTAEGVRKLRRYSEQIEIAGGEPRTIEYEWSIWGPVVENRDGVRFVHHWVGNDSSAFDAKAMELESATTAEWAMRVANESGMPQLNFVTADSEGNIGWTLCGRIPRRTAPPAITPVDWSTGEGMWDGYLRPDEYPRVYNPVDGRLWTANNRILGGRSLELLGNGRYDMGARARRIRDRLRAEDRFSESDLLDIQLDDQAEYLQRWQAVLLAAVESNPASVSEEFVVFVKNWGDTAAIDSVGYRIVNEFRYQLLDAIFGFEMPWRRLPRQGAFSVRTDIARFLLLSYEDVIWALLETRPEHWLPKEYQSWNELLAEVARRTEAKLAADRPLSQATWGALNTVRIQHPISTALPFLSAWLDMPNVQLPGDQHMPRVQGVDEGASQRMVVSPGHEEEGIYHQPGGQSGHPYSPFYRAGFDDWAEGKSTPLLPGPARHQLTLRPRS